MKNIKLASVLILSALLYATNSNALSQVGIEGKSLFPACNVCHNAEAAIPLGPPMWGVQRRYKRSTIDDEDFIKSMVSFVKNPTIEKAIHDEALKQLGLMPPMPLPDTMLHKIATYILEEKFPPPCTHWRIAVQRAEKKGDIDHAKKDKMMIDRFCK